MSIEGNAKAYISLTDTQVRECVVALQHKQCKTMHCSMKQHIKVSSLAFWEFNGEEDWITLDCVALGNQFTVLHWINMELKVELYLKKSRTTSLIMADRMRSCTQYLILAWKSNESPKFPSCLPPTSCFKAFTKYSLNDHPNSVPTCVSTVTVWK